MQLRFSFLFALFFVTQGQSVYANCSQINQHARQTYSALVAAKDNFKRETEILTQRPFSAETVEAMIESNRKIRVAVNETIQLLERAMTNGCLGRDAARWKDAIEVFKRERDELVKTGQMYRSQLDRMKPTPQRDVSDLRKEFRRGATCIAYWRTAGRCAKPLMKSESDYQRFLDMMDQGIEVLTDHLEELGRRIGYDRTAQKGVIDDTSNSMSRVAGGKCENFQKLLMSHREPCAELFKEIGRSLSKQFEKR